MIRAADRAVRRRWAETILVAAVSLGAPACATYSERMAASRAFVSEGSYDAALETLNKALGVDRRSEIPDRFRSQTALLLLDRGMISQAQGEYLAAARDLEAADERLEYLDISDDAAGTIGKYVYSDSSTKYVASPVEKLTLNSLNMLNRLAIRDLAGARVEAKRYTVMREYLSGSGPAAVRGTLGAYLAGFVFERLGETNTALRYYDEALSGGDLVTLAPAVARLATRDSYRGEHLEAFLRAHSETPSVAARMATEILTVVSLGRAPIKVPERLPIGAAIGLAGTYITGDESVLGYTATKVLVYPVLASQGGAFSAANVLVDGRTSTVEIATDVAAELSAEYEEMKPKILGAAISRMIVRAAAAEGARAAGQQAGGDAGSILGWIGALLTEATLVAFDQPDTRSWTLLPDRVLVSRTSVAPGRHKVDVDLLGVGSERRTFDVDLPEGGFAVIVVTPLR